MLRVGVEEECVLVARDGTSRSVVAVVLQYSTSLEPQGDLILDLSVIFLTRSWVS
jgi:hypothetical protein